MADPEDPAKAGGSSGSNNGREAPDTWGGNTRGSCASRKSTTSQAQRASAIADLTAQLNDDVIEIRESAGEKNPKYQRKFGVPRLRPTLNSKIDSDGRKSSNVKTYMLRGKTYAIEEQAGSWRIGTLHLIASWQFDTAIAAVIVSNAVTIGLDLSLELEGIGQMSPKRMPIFICEQLFLTIYCIELGCRMFALSYRCLEDHWVKLDAVLVITGVLTNWVLEPIIGSSDMSSVTVLRIARLLRVARAVRILVKFRDLWVLVRALLNSAGIIVYSISLLFVVLYICSCAGVELIANHRLMTGPDPDPIFQEIAAEYFDSVHMTMLTLVQFVCMDSIGEIYRPLVRLDAFLVFYFMMCIVVLGIVLMNLITAVIVNGAVEQAQSDKEAMRLEENRRREKFVKDLRRMFVRLDVDGSGSVTREELQEMADEDQAVMYGAMMIGNPTEIFDCLDTDNDGSLDIDEFCDGIWEVAVAKSPIQLKRLNKEVSHLRQMVRNLVTSQDHVGRVLNDICEAQRRSAPLKDAFGRGTSTRSEDAARGTAPSPSRQIDPTNALELCNGDPQMVLEQLLEQATQCAKQRHAAETTAASSAPPLPDLGGCDAATRHLLVGERLSKLDRGLRQSLEELAALRKELRGGARAAPAPVPPSPGGCASAGRDLSRGSGEAGSANSRKGGLQL